MRCRQSSPGSAANADENPEEESCPAASSGNHNHPSLPGSLYSKCQPQKTCFSPLWPPSLSLLLFLGGGVEEVKGAGLYLGVEAKPPLRLLSLGLQQQDKSRYFSLFLCVCAYVFLCLLLRGREEKKKEEEEEKKPRSIK